MHFSLVAGLLFLAFNIGIDVYIRRRLKGHSAWQRLHTLISAALAVLWIVVIATPKSYGNDAHMQATIWALYTYISFYLPKYLFTVLDLLASVRRLFGRRRIKLLTAAGGVLAAIVFAAMWWGAFVGRFELTVVPVDVEIEHLPDSFKGLRIAQVSDWHVGSYGTDTTFVSRTVDSINALGADIVVFTGDIVNRHSDELRPFVKPLSRLRAPLGVYSIMGNHDYGDYHRWPGEAAHAADADSLRAMQRRMGWHMLDNSTAMLRRGADSVALIGVENIGEPPFATRGNLTLAYPTVSDSTVKILLSHNPRHWTDSIAGHSDKNIALTLSGHTHAMQIEIGGYSPAKYRYPTWGGLYADSIGHQLYVNRGLGTVGPPMRIGAAPEITLITLR